MVFVTPAAEDFLDRYPEFEGADPDFVNRLIQEAVVEVDDSWIEADRVPAILVWVAYKLEQYNQNLVPGPGEPAGPIVRKTVGPLSVMYQKQSDAVAGGSNSTPVSSTYWDRFLELRKRNHPAVAIV